MESNNQEEEKKGQTLTEEEKKQYKKQIDDLKEDFKNSGFNSTLDYIEKELKGLKLDAE